MGQGLVRRGPAAVQLKVGLFGIAGIKEGGQFLPRFHRGADPLPGGFRRNLKINQPRLRRVFDDFEGREVVNKAAAGGYDPGPVFAPLPAADRRFKEGFQGFGLGLSEYAGILPEQGPGTSAGPPLNQLVQIDTFPTTAFSQYPGGAGFP
jgi:hypothetical protein